MVRVRRSLNAARGKPVRILPKPQPIPYPLDLEEAYVRDMRRVTEPMRALTHAEIIPLIAPLLAEEKRSDTRMDRDPAARFRKKMDQLRADIYQRTPADDMAKDAGERGNRRNRDDFKRQVKQVLGVDAMTDSPKVMARITSFTVDNVALIKSIPANYLDQVERLVISSVHTGRMIEDITADVWERYGVAESRARLIARDQVGKLNGALTKVRHEAVGVTRYVWQTAGDSRVRDTHAPRDGKTFTYGDPPEGGEPGQDFQCRCTAIPIFDPALYQ